MRIEKTHYGWTRPSLLMTWHKKALRNVKKWGLQELRTIVSAMTEEMGEVAQAVNKYIDESGAVGSIYNELDDLAALILQMRWACSLNTDDPHYPAEHHNHVCDDGRASCYYCNKIWNGGELTSAFYYRGVVICFPCIHKLLDMLPLGIINDVSDLKKEEVDERALSKG